MSNEAMEISLGDVEEFELIVKAEIECAKCGSCLEIENDTYYPQTIEIDPNCWYTTDGWTNGLGAWKKTDDGFVCGDCINEAAATAAAATDKGGE